jgi:undecaprenyl-diphosphatase
MEVFIAIIYALLQSITELLPISSSGHLVLLHYYFPLPELNPLAFDVSLHVASFFAIVVYFWQDWRAIFFNKGNNFIFTNRRQSLAWIFISLLPAGLIGWLAGDLIENNLRSPWLVVVALAVGAIIMIIIEKYFYRPQTKNIGKLNNALLIGLAQALALIPGISRSGATITTAMALGYDKISAAKISFIMAAPVIFAAGLLKIKDINWLSLGSEEWTSLSFALLVTFLTSLFVFKLLMKYLAIIPWRWFAYYRLAIAAVISGLLLL